MTGFRKLHFKRSAIMLSGFILLFTVMSAMSPAGKMPPAPPVVVSLAPAADLHSELYESLNLDSLELSKPAFDAALKGYNHLVNNGKVTRDDVLSIVDFSLPSSKKRLFVIDLETGKLLFNTYVSHGRNSGLGTATKFSNVLNSFQSSLGFYLTGNTYKGEHGYSLKLLGLEKGINDNAYNRGIVIHAANYVDEKLAAKRGYIGRSLGCPAIPVKLHKPIIQEIKDGTCLFVYAPNANYATHSSLLKSPQA